MTLTRGTAVRALAVALSGGLTLAASPAAASTGVLAKPRPAVRSLSANGLGCTFVPLDEINAGLDAVTLTPTSVVVAGRAPAGGGRAWAITSMGRDAASWAAPETAALRADTAADGSSVVAGRTYLTSYATNGTGWTRAALPTGTTGPVRSVAALSGRAAVVLLADGRTYEHGTTWARLPALPGTTLAVASVADRATALTVEKTTTAQRLRVWRLTGATWGQVSSSTVTGLVALTPANTVWAAAADGGALAVNSGTALTAVVRPGSGRVLAGVSLPIRSAVTAAEALPDGRVLLGHTIPASGGTAARGELSMLSGTRYTAVRGTLGDPITSIAATKNAAGGTLIATVRTAVLGAAGTFSAIATCG